MQKVLPKQADIDKIYKIIQRKVLKNTHLPVAIKEIQVGIPSQPIFQRYLCKCRFLILFLYMNQRVFSLTGLFLLRETSFQQITPGFIRS